MAILRALTKIQRERIEAAKPAPTPHVLFSYDAHVEAYKGYLVGNYAGKVTKVAAGKPVKAMKHWQSDYRSFTPKGVVLVSNKLKGVHARFAVK